MYDKKDKRRLYWLLDYYLSGKIDEDTFSDELHETFTLEMDVKTLTDSEYEAFRELNYVASRFSPDEEDQKLWAYSSEYVKRIALETKEKLKDQSPI
jgi:hypothetical protein